MAVRSKITIFAMLRFKSCFMRVVKVSKILKDLKRDGWYISRTEGSHREFKNLIKKGLTTVNGKESDDVTGFLLKSIEKQSGVKF